MLRLHFKNQQAADVDLTETRLTIGRSPDNDIVLDQEGVSGFHAEIYTENGRSYLVDLGSINGSFVNGQRATGRHEIKAWDTIKFDVVEIEVVDDKGRRPTLTRPAISDPGSDGNVATAAAAPLSAGTAIWTMRGETGMLEGASFALSGKKIIGRDASCDIVIDSSEVSRRHAELEVQGATLTLRDLGSTNGTFVNGNRISQTTLSPGDEISFDVNAFRVFASD